LPPEPWRRTRVTRERRSPAGILLMVMEEEGSERPLPFPLDAHKLCRAGFDSHSLSRLDIHTHAHSFGPIKARLAGKPFVGVCV